MVSEGILMKKALWLGDIHLLMGIVNGHREWSILTPAGGRIKLVTSPCEHRTLTS